jgi:hypothetical protein
VGFYEIWAELVFVAVEKAGDQRTQNGQNQYSAVVPGMEGDGKPFLQDHDEIDASVAVETLSHCEILAQRT